MSQNKDLNRELLKLAAFSDQEIEQELDNWLFATEACKLSDDDIEFALRDFIPSNWDVNFLGVRKLMGAYFRELIDICQTPRLKAEGKKLIYGILPAVATTYTAFKSAGGDDVFVSFPDLMLVTILNGYFDRADPFLTKAEDQGFTYGCRHCPLNKMRLAAYTEGIIPAADIIWSWGFNCDEGPKTDEMIQCLTGEEWQYVISRIPHDTYFGAADDEMDSRLRYMATVLRDGFEEIERRVGLSVSDEDKRNAIDAANRVIFKIGQLVGIVCSADPVPMGGNALTMLQNVVGVPFNRGYRHVEDALDTLITEMRAEVKAGRGILPKGAPKMGSFFVPFCIPWVDRIFRENGVATTFSETLTPSAKQMKPSAHKDDFYLSVAEQWLKMPLGQNMGYEVESMVEKVTRYKPDGMLMGFFDFDRWLGAHQKMAAKIVEERTGVPHFYMESDFWDDRDYSEGALRTRIESIAQILHMRK